MSYGKMTAFQRALLDSVLGEYQDVPKETVLEDIFSDRFEQWANDFIHEQKVKKMRTHRAIRVVLIAAILVALLVCTAFAIPVVREAFIDYFFQGREESVGISFDPAAAVNAPAEIEVVYALHDIPEGYELMLMEKQDISVYSWWRNSTEQWIYYSQHIIPLDSDNPLWVGLGSLEDDKKSILIGDYIVDIVQKETTYILVWTNNQYFFTLELPNSIDHDTMVRIFMSWEPVT